MDLFVNYLCFEGDLNKDLFLEMELMNKDLLIQTKDLLSNAVVTFKQDSKLAAAIDMLFNSSDQKIINWTESGLLLPGRKLEFSEVQQMLSQKRVNKGKLNISINIYQGFFFHHLGLA